MLGNDDHWPRFISRAQAVEWFKGQGLPMTTGTLASLARRGEGPPYQMFGRHAVYETKTLAEWLAHRLTQARPKRKQAD